MMRTVEELDEVSVHTWTEDEAYLHTRATFDRAFRDHPEIMEPWAIRLDGIVDRGERQEIMRDGLRKTFKARWA